jgi:hypothetical protein
MIMKAPKPKPEVPASFRELVTTIRMPSEKELKHIVSTALECATLLEKAERRGR